jgi:sugar phosphate isomerase/epimerase
MHHHPQSRRAFMRATSVAALAGLIAPHLRITAAEAGSGSRRMTISLAPGSIGVQANQTEAIDLAHRHGFESVEPYGGHLAGLSNAELDSMLGSLKEKDLIWGAAGLPVDFRGAEDRYRSGLKELPAIAAGLQRAGVDRVGTWLTPAHDELTYLQNFRRHTDRLREIASILKNHGARLGLEYVGPATSRLRRRYGFVHTLAEVRELIAAIGTGNVGVVLDSWHWYTARDTEAELRALTARDVVSVDLNDAPAGIPIEQQVDNRRELPSATGVIDLKVFLGALVRMDYDGPVRAEPFNQALNDLDNEAACAATIAAMKKAFALVAPRGRQER